MSQQTYPNTAYILSLIGGIFILLSGLLVAAVGAGMTFFIAGIGGLFGLFGVIWGIIIIVAANNLKNNPSQHVTWGIIILIFSLVSWFGSFGGFFIGFILALIGGILALAWSPPREYSYVPSYAPTPPPPTAPSGPSTAVRYCPNCGAPLPADVKFCPHCGKQVA